MHPNAIYKCQPSNSDIEEWITNHTYTERNTLKSFFLKTTQMYLGLPSQTCLTTQTTVIGGWILSMAVTFKYIYIYIYEKLPEVY